MSTVATLAIEWVAKVERLNSGVDAAAKNMQKIEDAAKRSSDGVSSNFKKSSDAIQKAAKDADGSSKAMESLGRAASVGNVALAGLGIAVAVAGAALASTIKPAMDFEATMLQIQATNDVSKASIDEMSQSLLSMASKVGQSPQKLAEGLYYVMGAGYKGAEAMEILEVSAKAAAVGMTDTQTVANAVTAVLATFTDLKTADAIDIMSASVATGKTEWADYSNVIGKVGVNAKQAGLRFVEATTAFSILTNVMPSSEQAAESLNSLLQTSSRFETLSSRAQTLGIAFDTNAYKSMTLIGRLEYLQKVTGGSAEEMTKLLGQENATAAATLLLTDGANAYSTALEGIAESTGEANKQFGTTSEGAQAAWNRATASVEALQTKIGMALLPVINSFTNDIAPMITQLMDWMEKNHVLENSMNAIVATLKTVGGAIKSTVKYFQENQAAFEALKVVAVILAGAIAGALVAALVAAAIALGTAIGAAAPFIAIGAAIALVVYGVILAIQNWGAIVGWLQGIWNAFVSWFMGILGAIGAFFTGIWTSIAGFFVGIWNGIVAFITGVWAGIIAGIQAAWNWIIAIVIAAGAFLLAAIMAPFIAIGNAFIWLYNHNYYFQALVDAIVGFISACVAWLQQAWQDVINWIVGAWQLLVGKASELWTNVSNAVRDGFNAAVGFVRWVWEQISSFFVNAWNTYIVGPLTSLWSSVSSLFSSAWSNYVAGPISSFWTSLSNTFSSAWSSYVSTPLNNLWNSIKNLASGWAKSAIDFGKNVIQGFIDGIKGMLGKVGEAASSVAKKAWEFLGFHSPTKEGPGRFADKWAPAFVDMYAKGLEAGVPKIQNAVSKLAMPIGMNFKGADFAPMQYKTKDASASGGSAAAGSAEVHVHTHVYIDGRELSETAGRRIVRESRKRGVS